MPLLPLEAVSERTGESVVRLRSWCATGRLSCERVDGEWVVLEADLPRVLTLAVERHRDIALHGAVGVFVQADHQDRAALAADIEDALQLAPGSVTVAPLVLDGQDQILILWPAAAGTGSHVDDLFRMADALGGELLDGDAPPGR